MVMVAGGGGCVRCSFVGGGVDEWKAVWFLVSLSIRIQILNYSHVQSYIQALI